MSDTCFNCQHIIDNPKDVQCPHCGINFKSFLLEKIEKSKGDWTAFGALRSFIKEYGKESLTPSIYVELAVRSTLDGEMNAARKLNLLGSCFGLTSKTRYYNTAEVQNIGRCIAALLTQYELNKERHDIIVRATSLAYIYLSHSIKVNPASAQYAHAFRATLLKFHKYPLAAQEMMADYRFSEDLFIISDFYNASKARDSAFPELFSEAESLHVDLEDYLTIAGKSADEYSLDEIAQIGGHRQRGLFEVLEQKFYNGDYDITMEELESMFIATA